MLKHLSATVPFVSVLLVLVTKSATVQKCYKKKCVVSAKSVLIVRCVVSAISTKIYILLLYFIQIIKV